MEIICPECQFSREVDETKIPARSQVATCPKCQTKFQFRELPPEDEFVVSEPESAPEQDVRPQAATEEPPKPAGPAQATLPVDPEPEQEVEQESQGETDPGFPDIAAPDEKPKQGLWDKLHNMAPPVEKPERKPPVIGSKYKPEGETPEAAPEQQREESGPTPVPGWSGEFNDSFPDPMHDESAEEQEQASPTVPPPFEQLDRYGFFHGLYMTIKLVLTSPRLFFSVMPVGGGLAKPLTFTILLTMIQGFVQYFWGMAGLSVSVGPEDSEALAGVSNALAPILMLLFMPAFIAAGQFMITGIYHILLVLMRADSQGFEGTFRALTYANAPIILGLFPMPMAEIEIAWMGIAAIWGLFLTIMGLKYIHKTSFAKVVPVALIPLLLGMIAALALFQGGAPTI